MGHFVIDCTNEHVAPGATKADAASIAFSAEDGDADCRREWIVDSGATSHMTGRLGNLINVQELVEPRELTVASGDNLVATTSDTGPFVRNGEDVCVLQEVLLVRGFACNLVSVAAVFKNGMRVVFDSMACTIVLPSAIKWRRQAPSNQ
ncbi:hypothetical protein PF003_g10504 [Phytophthora fragariae]|nr:hypothetical protein PF003_g10504 [Phytophthora fragariae]